MALSDRRPLHPAGLGACSAFHHLELGWQTPTVALENLDGDLDALAALVALAGLVALAAQEHEPAASYEESPVGHERNRRMGAVAGAAGALGHEGAAEALTGQASRAALAALAAAPAPVRRDPKTSLLHLALSFDHQL